MCRKKKRVIHPRYHSPCQTPYTALRSLLSVALSSGMVKSNLIIPFISDKVNVQPFRRHCSVISDEGVQFKTARVFNSTAIFNSSDLKIKTLATAGVRLDFYTDADIISFDYKMIRASSRNLAFFDVYIDNMFAESVSHNDIDFEFTDKFSKSLKKGRKRITIFFLTYLICKLKTSN